MSRALPVALGMRRWWRACVVAGLLCAGRAGAQAAPPPPGSELDVYVMTMGVGDAVWERFGHNAIGIRDRSTGTDVVYNWGVFRFTDSDFLPRFLRGENRYSVEPADAMLTAAYYQSINRAVGIQELRLTPAQRVVLRDFIAWNTLEENKYYRYDYFSDNCSTRVRDVLDKALGGALQAQFGLVASGMSFRGEARRLMEPDPLTYTGIDIGLGSPSDREMTRMEAMFIPMRLRDALREVKVPDDGGALVPLVSAERTVYAAVRSPEAPAPANHQLRYLLIGLALAAMIVGLDRAAPTAARRTAAAWCWIAGILGVLMTGLWTLTRHVWAYENVNLLFFNPLWFALAVLVARRAAPGGTGRRLAMVCAALAVAGIVMGFARVPQRSEQMAALVLAPHAVVFWLLLRRRTA